MRILIVTTVARTMEAFLVPLMRHLRAQGWVVEGAARGIRESSECVSALNAAWELPWSRNPLSPRNLLGTSARLKQLVTQRKYDIVHVHTPVAAFVTRFALRGLPPAIRPQIIYTAHGFHFHQQGNAFKNLLFRALEKCAGRWTDFLVVINRDDEAAAKRHEIVRPSRVRFMPGIGVDTVYYRSNRDLEEAARQLRVELGISGDVSTFLMIAEFNAGKRHRDVLEAFSLLQRSHQAFLLFAGDGPLFQPMVRLAESLGVHPWVRFLGHRSDIRELIQAADVKVLPSEREGLPRSVMESLCMAVPVIGSNVRGIRDLVGSEHGKLFDVGNISALSEAMIWMIENPVQRSEMGLKGRIHMQQYDIRKVLTLHDQLYAEALTKLEEIRKSQPLGKADFR